MNDLISRQALCKYTLNQKDMRVTPNDIMRFPSAQPELKKGRWVLVHPLQSDDEAYMCSVCETGDYDIKPTDKYCKFCGAEMMQVEGEDE